MFLKLLTLLIRTRFSKSYLIIISLVFLYSILALWMGFTSSVFIPKYYLGFIFAIFLVPSTYMGGLSINEADRDFLFTSAIRNRDLIPTFYLAQAIASSMIFMSATLVYLTLLAGNLLYLAYGIISVICMSLLPISMSLNMAGKSSTTKISICTLESLWILTSFFGYSIGPISFLDGGPGSLISMLMLLTITVITTGLAFLSINAESLPFRFYSFSARNNDHFTRNQKFAGMRSEKAVIKLNFTQVDFTSRMASVGNIRVRVNRISVYKLFVVMCIFSAAYFAVSFFYIRMESFQIFIATSYIAWFLIMAMSSGTMSKERAWLSLSAMPIESYMRLLMVSKIIQALFVSLPFSIVTIFLVFEGILPTSVPLLFLFVVPSFAGINFTISLIRKPYQVLQEDILPSIYNSSQFMTVPISLFMLFFIFLVMIYPFAFLLLIPATLIVIFASFFSRFYWQNGIYRWIEMGYV